MQEVAVGTDDFKYLIEEDCLFVDKSLFIEKVLKDKKQVKLFLRPRRFGKSLNLSMLKYFFNIEGATENKELFKGLKIENSPYFSEMGKYPVIYLNMKDLGNTYEKLERNLNNKIHRLFVNFNKVLESDLLSIDEKKDYIKIKDSDAIDIPLAVDILCSSISKFYGQQVVVLIDEYDAPLVKAYKHGYYNEAVELLSQFYGTLLKSNTYLQFAVIVGIVRYSKTSIYSSLNNLKEYNILTKSFDEFFGFTEDEVQYVLKKYNLDSNLDSVRNFYDGYKFGDIHVYNPWSITNYLCDKELISYWVGTSKNFLLEDLLKLADESIFNKLKILLNGGFIQKSINLTSALDKKLNINEIWSLLFFAGYLTIDDSKDANNNTETKLKIPNKEVFTDFARIITDVIFDGSSIFEDLRNDILANDFEKFYKDFSIFFEQKVSFLNFVSKTRKTKNKEDSAQNNSESKEGDTDNKSQHSSDKTLSQLETFYHLIMICLGSTFSTKYYVVHSELECGYGRCDLLIQPLNQNDRGFIFEFKCFSKYNIDDNENDEYKKKDLNDKLESKAQDALEQIEDRKYYSYLEQFNIKHITIVGLAFCGKRLAYKKKDLVLENRDYVETK